MHEEIYRARNEIQEAQLRYLSTRKIEDNKRGYLARQCQQQKELD